MKNFSTFVTEAKVTDTTRWNYYMPDVMQRDEIEETFGMTPMHLETAFDNQLDIDVGVVFFKYQAKGDDNLYVEVTYRQPAVINNVPSQMAKEVGGDAYRSNFKKWERVVQNVFAKPVQTVHSEVYRTENNYTPQKSLYRDHMARAIFKIASK